MSFDNDFHAMRMETNMVRENMFLLSAEVHADFMSIMYALYGMMLIMILLMGHQMLAFDDLGRLLRDLKEYKTLQAKKSAIENV